MDSDFENHFRWGHLDGTTFGVHLGFIENTSSTLQGIRPSWPLALRSTSAYRFTDSANPITMAKNQIAIMQLLYIVHDMAQRAS